MIMILPGTSTPVADATGSVNVDDLGAITFGIPVLVWFDVIADRSTVGCETTAGNSDRTLGASSLWADAPTKDIADCWNPCVADIDGMNNDAEACLEVTDSAESSLAIWDSDVGNRAGACFSIRTIVNMNYIASSLLNVC